MSSRTIRVGTRGSQLALWQTEHVIAALKEAHPGLAVEVEVIKTQGDKILDVPLAKIGDRGLFVREIEEAMLDGRIDLAVHSLKDLQTVQPDGLTVAAVLKRADARDVLVCPTAGKIWELRQGSRVGTSSLRRKAQLAAKYPGMVFLDVRGNVQTRLAKLDAGEYDALILAAAGLDRLGLEGRIAQRIPMANCLPAVGQGAMAVEARIDDAELLELLKPLEHADTRTSVTAERAFLRALEGGCQVPIGAYATVGGSVMRIAGVVCSLDGQRMVRADGGGPVGEADEIGKRLAQTLIDQGASEILAELRAASSH